MSQPRVLIVGSGFAGLQCARGLAGAPVEVLLIDRNNYHLFSPLLYQVASSLLNPSDIAYPIRAVFGRGSNVRFLMGEAANFDPAIRTIRLSDGTPLRYDYLVVAAGSEPNFFGSESAGRNAFSLKTLPEALELRNHVLRCFETAARLDSAAERAPWLTFVIVGGGPTGVEYAVALAELVRLITEREYPEISRSDVHIILLEGLPGLFPTFDVALGCKAKERLESLGVTVRLGTRVSEVVGNQVIGKRIVLTDKTEIDARTLVWAAGVQATSLAKKLPAAKSRSGRIEVDEFLRVKGQDRIYAIGDIASIPRGGREIPMIAAPAMQEGRLAAANIRASVLGRPLSPFLYKDPGMMAIIGRNAGIAQIGRLSLSGPLGWLAWLFVHLFFLIGFRNRLVVLLSWAWDYIRRDRPIRLIARADARD